MRFQPRYPELSDAAWLEDKYLVEQLSSYEIAKILGCHSDSVIRALRRNHVTVRDNVSARHLVPLKSHRYPLLNDREWLYEHYIEHGLSTIQLAELAGAKTCNSARQALMRFGIKVRNYREGQVHKLEDDGLRMNEHTLEIIEGGLLGDAHMRKWRKQSNLSAPMFVRKNKYRDHVLYVSRELGLMDSRVNEDKNKCRGKIFTYYRFNTFSHDFLQPLYHKWYPASNNYEKVVPCDFVLNPVSLLHWFMDDGCSELRKRSDYKPSWHKKAQIAITFCSESFSRKENEFLINQLASLGIRASLSKTNKGKGYRIYVPQSQASAFFTLIGPPPVASLAYKWKSEAFA